MGNFTHLYLVRHGEAVCNVEPIIGGMRGDTGLTERGVQQAEALRERLATGEVAVDVLVVSTLARARQTAEIIAPALGCPIVWEDDVQEIRVGQADGMSHEEAWSTFGSPDFDDDPFRPISPGGENWGQFSLRVSTTYHRLLKAHQGKRIMIVCHGGVIDCSFAYFLHINTRMPQRQEFYPHNTSITHWEQYTYRGLNLWRLACYNDTAHLHTIGMQESPQWANVDAQAG